MKNTLEFATNYLQTWLEALENDSLKMHLAWHNAHQWTVAHMANVLYPLAQKLKYGNDGYGTTMQQEYYRVDFSLYSYFGPSVWTLDYAIEHENNEFVLEDNTVHKKGWFDEFTKLLPLKCAKSRVIIGYDRFEKFDDKLKKCHDLLTNKDVQASLTDSPILLIVFPYTGYMQKQTYQNGLLHIVEFVKESGEWQSHELASSIVNNILQEKLKAVYAKIATQNK